MNTLPADYEERVYAGVLGKIIGVYLGRPFEGWTNKRIEEELGEINYYVHERLGAQLIVADDDISGTFTFLRAINDHGAGYDLTAEQIGKTWLNYLIEKRTVLWWGGVGMSTEHTAYSRLKAGIPAPQSGSIALNGPIVAEQIGAQIFIDGWAMICPGDPDRAVALAGRAASVSHDGEAIFGAQVVAAIESMAFVESDLLKLITTACTFIPRNSTIYGLIQDLLAWREAEPTDWRATFRKIEEKYGYHKYGGGVHMVPNHAVIILALLYGRDDFQRSLMIANTAGWDTDCNSGNVGCIMGIKNGLEGINRTVDFRTPVSDRMYLPSADGGRCITDAVRETYEIVNTARALQGMKPRQPNQGMRFHFNLPGATQGFMIEDSIESKGVGRLDNVKAGDVEVEGPPDEQMLTLHYTGVAPGRVARTATPTFLPPEVLKAGGYSLVACPTVYSGQILRARLLSNPHNVNPAEVRLYVRHYGKKDQLERLYSEPMTLEPGDKAHFHWEIPDTGGCPIAEIGFEVGGDSGTGTVYLDWMGYTGTPKTVFRIPDNGCTVWRRGWVNACDDFWGGTSPGFVNMLQNKGTGLAYTGKTIWCEYSLATEGHAHLADSFGIVAFVRGLRRYVSVALSQRGEAGRVCLLERYDEQERVLADAAFPWELYESVAFSFTGYRDGTIVAGVASGEKTANLEGVIPSDRARGATGFLVQNGLCRFGPLSVSPAPEILVH